jgi:hypothetical protein
LYFHKVDVYGSISSNFITVAHVPTPNDNSDADSHSGSSQSSDGNEEPMENLKHPLVSPKMLKVGWQHDTPFEDIDTKSKFDEEFARRVTCQSLDSKVQIGYIGSPNSVKSPIKAWKTIFKDAILNKIVKYTNEYGGAKVLNME